MPRRIGVVCIGLIWSMISNFSRKCRCNFLGGWPSIPWVASLLFLLRIGGQAQGMLYLALR